MSQLRRDKFFLYSLVGWLRLPERRQQLHSVSRNPYAPSLSFISPMKLDNNLWARDCPEPQLVCQEPPPCSCPTSKTCVQVLRFISTLFLLEPLPYVRTELVPNAQHLHAYLPHSQVPRAA